MVRELKEAVRGDGSSNINESLSSAVSMIFWVLLAMLSLITATIFACADGASKDKASATQNDTYRTACAAGCGAGCGA
ncbi:hypothetical protein I3760_06G016700 [Carya illinoinensis]|uniref:Uncharacterized protein n=1 Tax=Carya illinoinensis TaxID=32201 RepID=A0A8T1Q5L0_CARIL|nr:hypothetical protein I3760_06G016700 [Carya illinoinensis]KAG6650054.1 hypothetical protein CIPAW_06G016700 [Carya illinoinensis]KAG6707139.1 hypothetical protein I3842_06G016900 [Carya illinoinensis]